MVDFNHTIIGQFPYLNNSQNVLIASDELWASAVNYPYQVIRSFYSAIVSQYESQFMTTVASEALSMGASAFAETAGYFFSNYAVGCFVTALLLNRIVAMSSLRSAATVVQLPLWSRVVFHGIAIGTLLYNVTVTIRPGANDDPNAYFAMTYAVICLSHCLETFISTTSNTKPMEEFDYSIFELSMHFYTLTRSGTARQDYVPDCLMALLGRLIIHIVEISNRRRYRLLCSTILNVGHLGYLAWSILNEGVSSLTLLVKYRHIPKTMALVCISVSVACYGLACLARLSPFGSSDLSVLRFHSFMQSWYSTLNCTGEEEFTSTLINFAVLICNPVQTQQAGIHRELSQLTHQNDVNRSFLVSGYMNKQQTEMKSAEIEWEPAKPVWRRKWDAMWGLEKALENRIISLFQAPKPQIEVELERNRHDKNLNDYVSDNNYRQFFARAPDLNANVKGKRSTSYRYLLPEEDWSADYVEDDSVITGIDSDDSEDLESDLELLDNENDQSEETHLRERQIGNELTDLLILPDSPNDIADQDPQWLLSMWSILQCETKCNRRLTRSQYASLNESSVLREIMTKRAIEAHSAKPSVSNSDRDLSCVVCKTNVRNIVLWPCKCFAICEECRVSLGLRGFNTCICCRAPVKGYSRINAV
ncbi:LAME_0F18162g1_1 [Lachancea meyersii CBS 8951]|uniref:LAME_0F18162g1_1 n=1 Tax=Lachancea meyersii CBS 8951 TaxID=1266667 RepID=A0A1G4K0F0_9SACH|nr:LAME_0F18162g1_1 [Lachancea meyersii CBS 8951]